MVRKKSKLILKGQIALITGGGKGLSLGIAKCFAASGAKVILVGRRKVELKKDYKLLERNALPLTGDVTDLEMIPALVDRAEKLSGPVTVLVNNAGIHLKKAALETFVAEFAAVLQTHGFGAFALTRDIGRRMVERKEGNILFTASMASLFGIPQVMAYSAAKSAYVGMVRTLAAELGPQDVRVNAIAPGWIESDMMNAALDKDPTRSHTIKSVWPSRRHRLGGNLPLQSSGKVCHRRRAFSRWRRFHWISVQTKA